MDGEQTSGLALKVWCGQRLNSDEVAIVDGIGLVYFERGGSGHVRTSSWTQVPIEQRKALGDKGIIFHHPHYGMTREGVD